MDCLAMELLPPAAVILWVDSGGVWSARERIGANEPTTIHLTGPASIQGVEVGAGSYSIYGIPGAEEWRSS